MEGEGGQTDAGSGGQDSPAKKEPR
jgi:hypothetical protein